MKAQPRPRTGRSSHSLAHRIGTGTPPSYAVAYVNNIPVRLTGKGARFTSADIAVTTRAIPGGLAITVAAETTALERVHLRWPAEIPPGVRFLGDAWERAYGNLEWRGLVPERIMPWYFLAYDGKAATGCGVKTQSGALCFWTIDSCGINLWLDVCNGGSGVELRGRELAAATIVTREGQAGESPFSAARAFCRLLCDNPRMPAQPLYGSNNYYYTYGDSRHADILDDTRLLGSLAPPVDNRPFMVIDAGWQPLAGDDKPQNMLCGGPYTGSNPRFPDMPGLASGMRNLGARPGIWIRPLAAYPDDPPAILLPVERATDDSAKIKIMDPSIPEVLERITADFRILHDWGYELIKHDWSLCDILGRWGFQMGGVLTLPGWHFADRTRTTAEIILASYRAMRTGAKDSLIVGCNTIGHMAAGLFESQRIGDDTSGIEWERTRKFGINALAFRGVQHGALFAADSDCFGHTSLVPWEKNVLFLDIIARSGTPLFVSIAPKMVGKKEAKVIRAAYATAAQPQELAEPLDWFDTTCPAQWKLNGKPAYFDWFGKEGVQVFTKTIPPYNS